MRFLVNERPRGEIDVSLILLDWGCRESFHILDYLAEQTVDRSRYEIIWIEYYDPSQGLLARINDARAAGQPPPVDVYVAMEMDKALCHHKHLMMNLGIVLAGGTIVCFADSDALVRPTFVRSVIEEFEHDDDIALHLDEVRNCDPSFYPFTRPDFEDITGFGCINWLDSRPIGLLDKVDLLHTRNYGACMAATRRNLISIGGADMHIDYLGHIAGSYEMTWRLINSGKREVWHQSEWLYHVWHPGQAGSVDFGGPHDGMHISTRALQCRHTGRIKPFVENPAIRLLSETDHKPNQAELLEALVDPQWTQIWRYDQLGGDDQSCRLGTSKTALKEHGVSCDDTHNFQARPQGLFGRTLRRRHRLRYVGLLLAMLWRQLKTKRRAVAWSRLPSSSLSGREWQRKFRALVSFVKRMFAFDRHWFRQCWRALCYAAQEGHGDLILYGEGDAAAILCALAKRLPVSITAICPFRSSAPAKMYGRPTISKEQLARRGQMIVVAAFVDTPAHLDDLEQLAVQRSRIITLQ